jgi:hypothetical protein
MGNSSSSAALHAQDPRAGGSAGRGQPAGSSSCRRGPGAAGHHNALLRLYDDAPAIVVDNPMLTLGRDSACEGPSVDLTVFLDDLGRAVVRSSITGTAWRAPSQRAGPQLSTCAAAAWCLQARCCSAAPAPWTAPRRCRRRSTACRCRAGACTWRPAPTSSAAAWCCGTSTASTSAAPAAASRAPTRAAQCSGAPPALSAAAPRCA